MRLGHARGGECLPPNARRDFLSYVINTLILLSIAWDSSLLSQLTLRPTLHVDRIHSEALMTIVWAFDTNHEPILRTLPCIVFVVEPSHSDFRMTIWLFNYEVVQQRSNVLHMICSEAMCRSLQQLWFLEFACALGLVMPVRPRPSNARGGECRPPYCDSSCCS